MTVVIAVYNSMPYLMRCLDSLVDSDLVVGKMVGVSGRGVHQGLSPRRLHLLPRRPARDRSKITYEIPYEDRVEDIRLMMQSVADLDLLTEPVKDGNPTPDVVHLETDHSLAALPGLWSNELSGRLLRMAPVGVAGRGRRCCAPPGAPPSRSLALSQRRHRRS